MAGPVNSAAHTHSAAPHSAANALRGDAVLSIDGRRCVLRLTLGALAELETAFDVSGFSALAARLQAVSASDLLIVIAALLRGGGDAETAHDLAGRAIDPSEAARAVAQAFERACG